MGHPAWTCRRQPSPPRQKPSPAVLCCVSLGAYSISCRLIAGAAHAPWMRLRIFKAMSISAERRHTDVEIVVGTPISDGGNNAGAPTKADTLALMLRPRSMRLPAGVPVGTTGGKKTPCHKTPPMLTGDGENTWDAARLPGASMAPVGESGCWWACGARRHNKMDNPTVAPAAGVSCGYAAAVPAGGGGGEKAVMFFSRHHQNPLGIDCDCELGVSPKCCLSIAATTSCPRLSVQVARSVCWYLSWRYWCDKQWRLMMVGAGIMVAATQRGC